MKWLKNAVKCEKYIKFIYVGEKTEKANINSIDDRPSRTIQATKQPSQALSQATNTTPTTNPIKTGTPKTPPAVQVQLLQMAEFELGKCVVCVCVCVEEEKQTNRRTKAKENKMHKMLICG